MAEAFLYLNTIGRKSGALHKIEIWYVNHDDCYYLCSGNYENADWVKNILQESSVTFYIADREQDLPPAQPAQAHIVTDDALIAILSAKFKTKYDWNTGLFVEICHVDD